MTDCLGLLAPGGEASGPGTIDLRLGDFPVAVGVHTVEHSCNTLRTVLGRPIVKPRLKGRDLVLRDEAVVIQIQIFELLPDARGHLGPVLV